MTHERAMISENNSIRDSTANDRARRYIIGLIVLHTILVLFAVFTFTTGFTDYKWPRWQSIFIEALATGQIGLLAAALLIGTTNLPARIIVLAVVLTFWLIVLNDLGLDQEYWLAIFAIQIAGTGSCLAIARLFGARLICGRGADEKPVDQDAYRYSLRQMLFWTAAVSFLLCVGTVAAQFWGFKQSVDWGVLPRTTRLGQCLVPIMLVGVWATLGANRKIMPSFLLILVTAVASLAIARTDRLYRTAWWSSLTHESYQTAYMLLLYVYAIIVYLSLAVIRACGYRFAKHSRRAAEGT